MDYSDIKNPTTLSDAAGNEKKYKRIITILLFFLLIFIIVTIIFLSLYISEKNKTKDEDIQEEEKPLYKPNPNQYIEILENMDEEDDEGAQEYQGKHDILNSKYFYSYDFYNMKSSGSLILLEKFKTYQQTTSYTCGCASFIMAMHYLDNITIGERQCVNIAGTNSENGTKPEGLELAIEHFGHEYESKRTFSKEENPIYDDKEFSDYIKKTLRNKEPIIILSNDWAGHYTVIIGYDDMGNDNLEDDVVIVADPFDTTDHICDGYAIWSYERLYYQMTVTVADLYDYEFFRIKKKN